MCLRKSKHVYGNYDNRWTKVMISLTSVVKMLTNIIRSKHLFNTFLQVVLDAFGSEISF